MRADDNLGGTPSFHPNSAGLWANQPDFSEPPMPVDGEGAHWDHRVDDDHWEQPGKLFRLMARAQQQALFENTARAMGDAREHIKQRHAENDTRAAQASPRRSGSSSWHWSNSLRSQRRDTRRRLRNGFRSLPGHVGPRRVRRGGASVVALDRDRPHDLPGSVSWGSFGDGGGSERRLAERRPDALGIG
jgi:hypothetical protein